MLIGSLLGDGCVEQISNKCSRYSEAHAERQLMYLNKKYEIMLPYSRPVYLDISNLITPCYKFYTAVHSNFQLYRDLFYDSSCEGKLIPIDFIKDNWDDDILVYWYLDDGSYDVRTGCVIITNKCPKIGQLYELMEFLSFRYDSEFKFYIGSDGMYTVKFPLKFKQFFIPMVKKVVTEDMFYKIPRLKKQRYVLKSI
jgi:hypothetical protein